MDKIVQVREELEKKKAKAIVVTMLDEVAWLFNLRGSDIDFNPGELVGRVLLRKEYMLINLFFSFLRIYCDNHRKDSIVH